MGLSRGTQKVQWFQIGLWRTSISFRLKPKKTMIKEGKPGMKESWSRCGLGDCHLSSHSGNWLLRGQ